MSVQIDIKEGSMKICSRNNPMCFTQILKLQLVSHMITRTRAYVQVPPLKHHNMPFCVTCYHVYVIALNYSLYKFFLYNSKWFDISIRGELYKLSMGDFCIQLTLYNLSSKFVQNKTMPLSRIKFSPRKERRI